MDRRRFLRTGACALGTGLISPAWLRATEPSAGPDLVVARGDPAGAVPRALAALGGLERFLPAGGVVLIKPNLSFASPPEWGATTDPEVLGAVIEACQAAGARRVLVADHALGNAERCFLRTGATAVLERFPQAKLVSLDQERMYRPVEVPDGVALHQTQVAAAALRADLLINLPTAKAHAATGVSLGLKNLMGLVWDRNTFHNDMDIHVGIADLATVVRPQLTLLDAMRILQTNGPSGPGEIDARGILVAGTDPVAVDAYGVGLTSWNGMMLKPDQLAYLGHAARRGVGTLDLDGLRIVELT